MEKIELYLNDNEYTNEGYDNTRIIARAFVLNEENKLVLLYIQGDDIFGHRDYYETSGGGVEKGESLEEAIIRELDEEIGYKCEIMEYLGIVHDEYNLIKRKNENNYFLCKIKEKTKIHHVSYGDSMISEIKWFSIDEVLNIYNSMNNNKLARIVRNREYPIALRVKEILDN